MCGKLEDMGHGPSSKEKETVDETHTVKPGDPPQTEQAPLDENSTFSKRYRMDEELGRSNFSVVRRGIDRRTGRKIAVKCIAQSLLTVEDRTALKIEVAILQEAAHPNVCKFYGLFEEDNMFYLLTEYVDGGSLLERIAEQQLYSEAEARGLIRTIANALSYCHAQNIVHRNLVCTWAQLLPVVIYLHRNREAYSLPLRVKMRLSSWRSLDFRSTSRRSRNPVSNQLV